MCNQSFPSTSTFAGRRVCRRVAVIRRLNMPYRVVASAQILLPINFVHTMQLYFLAFRNYVCCSDNTINARDESIFIAVLTP